MQYDLVETSGEEESVVKSVAVLTQWMREAIADHGQCILGLSGGSTPRPVYQALGQRELEWEKVKIFLVDERYVSPGHKDSNQKMVREAFARNSQFSVPRPSKPWRSGLNSQFVFPDTSLSIDDCILQYSKDLKSCGIFSERLPDIMTLGLGEDGHIASLFPPLSSLAMSDERLVLHTTTSQFAMEDRITISLNAIASAEHHIFFLKGEGKKKVWEEMMASSEGAERWPGKAVLNEGRATVVALW